MKLGLFVSYKNTKLIASFVVSVVLLIAITAILSKNNDDINSTKSLLTLNFEDTNDLENIKVAGAKEQTRIFISDSFFKSGQSSLKLVITEPESINRIRPAVDILIPEPIDGADIQAISVWVHVPKIFAGHYFGRYDVRILINGGKPFWSVAAVKPGWNHLRWEFSNLYQQPIVDKIQLQFGPILPGYGSGEIHIDDLLVETIAPLDTDNLDDLHQLVRDASVSWGTRFKAIRALENKGELASLSALFVAVSDGPDEEGYNPFAADMQTAYIDKGAKGSQAVRSAALKAMKKISLNVSSSEQAQLKTMLTNATKDKDGRIRLAAIQVMQVIKQEPTQQPWIEKVYRQTLLDDIYYIRDAAYTGLKASGSSPTGVAKYLVTILEQGQAAEKIKAARFLSEVGSVALAALPTVVAILRDEKADHKLRQWCLRAAWWMDESVLKPEDWGLALDLEPGEMHRHLLNRAMSRLEAAGDAAIPALSTALTSTNPQVRARAAVLLVKAAGINLENSAATNAASIALEAAKADPVDYVRSAAGVQPTKKATEGSNVVVKTSDNIISFSNGFVDIEFDTNSQDPGPISARLNGGKNMIDGDWLYKVLSFKDTKAQSIIERVWYQKINGVPLNKNIEWQMGTVSEDQADIVFRYPADETFPLDWEIHYVLRKGDSGFYSYMVVKNKTGEELVNSTNTKGNTSIGMIRQLVAPTWGMFDTAVLHDNFKWPVSFTDEPDHSMYPDIYQATFRMPDGGVDGKHEAWNYNLSSPVYGYTGKEGGFWRIIPSLEFSGASWPWNQRTGFAHGLFITAYEDKYYIPVGVKITKDWQKIYGPMFFYMNQGENTEAMWQDAKTLAAEKVQAWPYKWLVQKGFHDRGSVKGQVTIAGMTSAKGAWAILAKPIETMPSEIEFGAWWRDVGKYHYVAKVQTDGSFDIPNVRSGDYDLFIWHEDVYGEYQRAGLTVVTGQTLDTGKSVLKARDQGQLLWQIGTPNRAATEFKNGNNYHQWDTYLRYRDDFPDDIHFEIGKSDIKKDWNYIQPAIVQGEKQPTSAVISFDFDPAVPGNPLLTVVAGGRGTKLEILVNDEKVGDLNIKDIGLQHVRTAPYGELTVHRYSFDRALLQAGNNKVTLRFLGAGQKTAEMKEWHYQKWTSFISYDFLRMEMVQKFNKR